MGGWTEYNYWDINSRNCSICSFTCCDFGNYVFSFHFNKRITYNIVLSVFVTTHKRTVKMHLQNLFLHKGREKVAKYNITWAKNSHKYLANLIFQSQIIHFSTQYKSIWDQFSWWLYKPFHFYIFLKPYYYYKNPCHSRFIFTFVLYLCAMESMHIPP